MNKGADEHLKDKIKYLHRGFPMRDSVSARELATLLRQYARVA